VGNKTQRRDESLTGSSIGGGLAVREDGLLRENGEKERGRDDWY